MDTDYTREEMLRLAVQSAGNSGYSTEGILQNAQRFTDFVKLSKKERRRRSKLSEGKADVQKVRMIGFDDLHPEVVVALRSLSEAVDQLQGQTLDRLAQVVSSPLPTDAARFAAEMEGTEGFPEQESIPQEKDDDVTEFDRGYAAGDSDGYNLALQHVVNLQETFGLTPDSSVSISQAVAEIAKLRK